MLTFKFQTINSSSWAKPEEDRRVISLKKKLVIELMIYIVIVVIGIIMLFVYEPKEVKIILPQDFKIEQEWGDKDAFIPIE